MLLHGIGRDFKILLAYQPLLGLNMKHKNKAVDQKLRSLANFRVKYKVALYLRSVGSTLAWKQLANEMYGPIKFK